MKKVCMREGMKKTITSYYPIVPRRFGVGSRPGDKLMIGRKRYLLLGLTLSVVVALTSSNFGLVVVDDAADAFAAAAAGVVAFAVAFAVDAFAFAFVVAASAS
jgi:hypothetical protein